jgi:glycosyltransferase involved in cell wall biosynthesis
MRRLRVAYLVGSLKPGGAEKQMLALAVRLPRDRFQVDFVTIAGPGEYDARAKAAGLGIRSLGAAGSSDSGMLVRLAHRASKTMRYVAVARAARYDVVDAWLYPADVLAALSRSLTGTPIIIAGRRNLGDFYATWGPMDRLMSAVAKRLTDVVVANSAAVGANTLEREHLKPAQLRIIRNGVELIESPSSDERAELRSALGVSTNEFLIGCVANYRPVKCLDLLIDAFASLEEANTRLRLVLVGEGPIRADLQQRIDALGLEGRVRLHGSVVDPKPLYGAFDLVVQASRSEGLPNALLEAAAAGLPIVATAAGGTAEIVIDGRTGLLVPSGDAAALASALHRAVADHGLRTRLGTAAREHVAAMFGMERFVAEFAALYEELAARKHLLP